MAAEARNGTITSPCFAIPKTRPHRFKMALSTTDKEIKNAYACAMCNGTPEACLGIYSSGSSMRRPLSCQTPVRPFNSGIGRGACRRQCVYKHATPAWVEAEFNNDTSQFKNSELRMEVESLFFQRATTPLILHIALLRGTAPRHIFGESTLRRTRHSRSQMPATTSRSEAMGCR